MENIKLKLEELENHYKQISKEIIATEGAIFILKELLKDEQIKDNKKEVPSSEIVISPPDPKKEEK